MQRLLHQNMVTLTSIKMFFSLAILSNSPPESLAVAHFLHGELADLLYQ
jgi:hypothetical protein